MTVKRAGSGKRKPTRNIRQHIADLIESELAYTNGRQTALRLVVALGPMGEELQPGIDRAGREDVGR